MLLDSMVSGVQNELDSIESSKNLEFFLLNFLRIYLDRLSNFWSEE